MFLGISGEVVERDLAPGERFLVHAGHVGVMDPTIQFDIQMVRGASNILFGSAGGRSPYLILLSSRVISSSPASVSGNIRPSINCRTMPIDWLCPQLRCDCGLSQAERR